jgi:transposase
MVEDRRAVVVGLDVHKSSVRLAAVRDGELLRERTLGYDHEQLLREVRAWPGARVCQEAGPTGFGLHRALVAAGVDSVIVAPGPVPSRPGDRVKTDKRDARRLAGLHAAGLLTEIFIPTPEHEALRDLVRAREDARLDRMRARHRLGKFCLRHERTMPTTCWGTTRRAWLGRQAFQLPGQQQAFDDYLFAVDQVDRRIESLQAELHHLAGEGPHRELIARLRCMRGIDTLTAIGLVAEAGDFSRFTTAEQFMSFVGLVPSERSSGEIRRQGSITKAGSAHARRLLVESAWNGRRRPTVGYELARRQRGQDPQVLEHAWRCQQRLHRRGQGWRAAVSPTRRLLSPAHGSSLGSCGRSPPSSHCGRAEERSCSSVGWRALPPRRRTLASPMRRRLADNPRC